MVKKGCTCKPLKVYCKAYQYFFFFVSPLFLGWGDDFCVL